MQDDKARETHRFDVERRVDNVFETYTGWVHIGTIEAEYELAALEEVFADSEVEGHYRVIRHGRGYKSLNEYTVTRRTEWDILPVEDAPVEAAA